MLDIRSKKLLGSTVLMSVVLVTLVMAPYTLVDPVNLPKMLVLAFFSIVGLSLAVPDLRKLYSSNFKTLTILLSLLIIQIFVVLLFSGANFGGQFYGTFARNTGALTYISLAFVLLSTSIISDRDYLKKFIKVTLVLGVILIVYGNIQYLGLEPFPFVNAYTVNAPIGTFGNPDFQSAFMGLIAVVCFTLVFNNSFKLLTRFLVAFMGISALIVVYETLAKQGYLNFVAGLGSVIILWLFMTRRKALAFTATGIGAIGAGLVFLGLINAGPLASLLYKGSLAARGYYWRAGVEMLTEHPFLGVGMDGFVDWYRRLRPENYLENGFLSISNAAHNVYLDIASSGGIPLITIYLALLTLVVISIIRVVKRSENFEVFFAAIVGAWVAYQSQAFVSINQIGLAIWGWVLSGLIIGYEINTRVGVLEKVSLTNRKQMRKLAKVSTQTLSSAAVLRVSAGVILGALVAIPPYYSNASFFSALKSSDLVKIEAAAYLKPIDERRLLHIATIYRDNKLDVQAVAVIRDAVKGYPDSFDFWQLWSTIPTAAPGDLAIVKAQLKRLDPFNPDIK